MMKILVLALAALLPGCFLLPATHGSEAPVPFELGAQDFPGGDRIQIDRVLGDRGAWIAGMPVVVEGHYERRSRPAGVLFFGVTNSGAQGATETTPGQQKLVERGSGTFTLWLTMPPQGWPHITFYDPQAGGPFGGVYFGSGDNVLHDKTWAYNPPPR